MDVFATVPEDESLKDAGSFADDGYVLNDEMLEKYRRTRITMRRGQILPRSKMFCKNASIFDVSGRKIIWGDIGYRGNERVADIRRIDIDIDRNKVIMIMLDGHRITFMYDPEGKISELLYGAHRRGSPDFESAFSVWLKEHATFRDDRKRGIISQKEYNRLYAGWKQRQPKEKDPDYVQLLDALSAGQISREDFELAYGELGVRKWSDQ